MLEIAGLTVKFGGLLALSELSFSVPEGAIKAVIGPNGAGKTTLIRTLLGEQPPDSGAVRVGSSISVGHYRQTHEHLDLELTVVDYLRRFVAGEKEQDARDLAGAFLPQFHLRRDAGLREEGGQAGSDDPRGRRGVAGAG